MRQRVRDLLGRMTLAEKIGQMTQAERASVADDPAQATTLALGSLLSGVGSVPTPDTATAWTDMVDGFQRRALATRPQREPRPGRADGDRHRRAVGATRTAG